MQGLSEMMTWLSGGHWGLLRLPKQYRVMDQRRLFGLLAMVGENRRAPEVWLLFHEPMRRVSGSQQGALDHGDVTGQGHRRAIV